MPVARVPNTRGRLGGPRSGQSVATLSRKPDFRGGLGERLASHDNDDGGTVVSGDMDSDRAEEQTGETSVTARPHYDHVGTRCLVEEHFGRMTLFGDGDHVAVWWLTEHGFDVLVELLMGQFAHLLVCSELAGGPGPYDLQPGIAVAGLFGGPRESKLRPWDPSKPTTSRYW